LDTRVEEDMRRSSLTVATIVFLSVLFAGVLLPPEASAFTRYVGGVGPGNYTTIQEAVDAAFPGNTVYVYNGTYQETVTIAKPLSLIGEDTNTTTIDTAGGGDGIHISSSWVNVTGFTIMNSGVRNGQGIELNLVRDCYIANNSIGPNFMQGILLYWTSGNWIVNNTVLGDSYSYGIDLRTSSNERILNNTLTIHEYGIYHTGSSYTTIKGNTMVGTSIFLMGLDLSVLNTHTIDTFNTVNGKPVYYWKNLSGGTVPSGAGEVIIVNCTDVIVENQNVSGGTVGIYITHSANITASNNTASNGRHGMMVFVTQNSTVSHNNASRNVGGFELQYAPGNTLRNNTAMNNTQGFLVGLTDSSDFTDNNASGNTYGFFVVMSHGNTFAGNTASRNSEGFRLTNSGSNLLYHNRIINNTVQAVDNGANQWDEGYPSGGNYWSDYNGTDGMSGPNQTVPGSDGIGDTPYDIDGDSRDRYPLMGSSPVIPPRPPTVQKGALSGAGQVNVEVIWLLSPDDGAGNASVTRYDVYRGSTYDPEGAGYQLVASVPNGTASYEDPLRGEGDPSSYFYLVCAVVSFNYTECAEAQAGKIARPHSPGPNLLSVPFVQADPDIFSVLNMVKYDQAWSYDASSGKWKWRMRVKDYEGSLTRIDHTMGVWVNVTADCNFTVAGMVPAQTSIQLHAGWNLVSFPSINAFYTVADLKADTVATRVEGHDATPPYFLRVLGDAEVLQAGYGYWVRVDTDDVWVVPFA
jgi:parallel beta-helix repeat protein